MSLTAIQTPQDVRGCVARIHFTVATVVLELEPNQSLYDMPIRAYLDGQKFDGETIRLMGIAFESALASFGATPDPEDPIRAALARNIIALAKAGEQDPERLSEGALRALGPPGPSKVE